MYQHTSVEVSKRKHHETKQYFSLKTGKSKNFPLCARPDCWAKATGEHVKGSTLQNTVAIVWDDLLCNPAFATIWVTEQLTQSLSLQYLIHKKVIITVPLLQGYFAKELSAWHRANQNKGERKPGARGAVGEPRVQVRAQEGLLE